MVDIMSSMKFALHAGTARSLKTASKQLSRWPSEFRRPIDAALHLGTPKRSVGPVVPSLHGRNRFFFCR